MWEYLFTCQHLRNNPEMKAHYYLMGNYKKVYALHFPLNRDESQVFKRTKFPILEVILRGGRNYLHKVLDSNPELSVLVETRL